MDLKQLPTHLKMNLLTLISQNNFKSTEKKNSEKLKIEKEDLESGEKMLRNLESDGYCVIDNFLDEKLSENIRIEIIEMKDELSSAGFGSGKTKIVNSEIRGDLHQWMNQNTTPKNMKKAILKCSKIKQAFNEILDLNLTNSSIQTAICIFNDFLIKIHPKGQNTLSMQIPRQFFQVIEN
jgi:hypothetical protein